MAQGVSILTGSRSSGSLDGSRSEHPNWLEEHGSPDGSRSEHPNWLEEHGSLDGSRSEHPDWLEEHGSPDGSMCEHPHLLYPSLDGSWSRHSCLRIESR